jgi:hypothetical protein
MAVLVLVLDEGDELAGMPRTAAAWAKMATTTEGVKCILIIAL